MKKKHERIIIIKLGRSSEREIKIKQRIQKRVLNYLQEYARDGKWIGGWTGLVFCGIKDIITEKYYQNRYHMNDRTLF